MLTDEQVKAEIEAYNESLLSQYAQTEGGRKFVEVLKVVKFDLASEAAHQVVCYRYPIEDLPADATIVVGHSQIGLLDLDGEILPLRPELRHVLRDEVANSNAIALNKVTKKFTGGDAMMHVKVYFIQLQKHPNIPFATSGGPLQAYDAIQKIGVKIRAHGLFTAKIDDSDLTAINAQGFLKEIVGERGIVTASEFQEQLKATVEGELPGVILPPLQNGQFPAMALSGNAPTFSKQLFDIVKPKFEANLIWLDELKIQKIQSEKDEEYSELLEARRAAVLAGGEAEAMRQKGYAAAEVRAAGGYSYQDERGYDVMQAAAGNNASMGTFMGAGMGLGMGMGMGAGMGSAMGNMANNTMGQVHAPGTVPPGTQMPPQGGAAAAATVACPQCGAAVPAGSKFCPSCGQPMPAPQAGPKFCPSCGSPLEPGAKFCPNCGAKLG